MRRLTHLSLSLIGAVALMAVACGDDDDNAGPATKTGGVAGAAGTKTGGKPAEFTGGTRSSGGTAGTTTGGTRTGGTSTGGTRTGGTATGGTTTGGTRTGGTATGGTTTGGTTTGGTATGGTTTGGTTTGGTATGGTSTAGTTTGGTATGGTSTAGTTTGGTATGGTSTAGTSTGGTATGGTETAGTSTGGTTTGGTSTGGTATGGTETAGTSTGGTATGGTETAGTSAGGTASGGTATTGGAAAGGTSTGGTSAGGTSAGGTSAGGTSAGGTSAGGTETGGISTGGTATGGTTGGSETGGTSTGGTATGGTETGGTGGEGGAPTANLLTNGDMEATSAAPWGANAGTAALETTTVHGGAQALQVTGRTDTWNGPQYNLLPLVTAGTLNSGDILYVTAWVRVSTASEQIAVSATIATAAGTSYITGHKYAANNTGWIQIAQAIPLVWGTTPTGVSLYLQGPAAGSDIFIDDVTAVLATNIITNGGFENGTTGWTSAGETLAVQSTVVRSGSSAVLDSARTATYQGPRQNLLTAVAPNPGASVGFTAWVRIHDNAGGGAGGAGGAPAIPVRATLNLKGGDFASDQYITLSSNDNVTLDTWTPISGTYDRTVLPTWTTAPTTATLYFEGPGSGVDLYVDDVTMALVPTIP